MDLRAEAEFFARCGIGKPDVKAAWADAVRNATSIERELIAARRLDPDIYYRFLAQHLGLTFADRIDPTQMIRPERDEIPLRRPGPVKIRLHDRVLTVLAPEARDLPRWRHRLARDPGLREALVVAAPQTIRDAAWAAGASERVRATTRSLAETAAASSARQVLTGRQGFAFGCLLGVMVWLAVTWPALTLDGVHLTFSSLFFGNILLRLAAASGRRSPCRCRRRTSRNRTAGLYNPGRPAR
ncbi:hypothetical protein [Hoeflea marina]|uniref:hypothetical protein n=1 Tax=Hoeflea marina TaxID=274592 RepID=UPI000D7189C3|nr:hypothetical protein [Hoeflea marina]